MAAVDTCSTKYVYVCRYVNINSTHTIHAVIGILLLCYKSRGPPKRQDARTLPIILLYHNYYFSFASCVMIMVPDIIVLLSYWRPITRVRLVSSTYTEDRRSRAESTSSCKETNMFVRI